jgi:hypothetical protein
MPSSIYIVHIMYGSNGPYDVPLMYYGMVKPLPIMGKTLMSLLMREQLID